MSAFSLLKQLLPARAIANLKLDWTRKDGLILIAIYNLENGRTLIDITVKIYD